MDVQVKPYDDATLIEVSGDIDGSTASILQEPIVEVSSQKDSRILLDMSQVDFMSSAGLRVMLLLYRQISANNGRAVLIGLSEEIQDTMRATGFLKFFQVADSVEEGKQKLDASS